MKKHSARCGKLTGILRILLGAGMLLFGVMKLGGDNPMLLEGVENLRGMGLDFLSTTARYRIATIGEILAGILLIAGYKTKYGARLALIIMVVAIVTMGVNPLAIVFAAISAYIIYAGSGNWAMQPCGCCGTKMGLSQQQEQQKEQQQ